ncbi:hypothetical protein EV383_6202 [Pseudonocardia sediminis]|uniref:Uncharacterized protein n=1 Tax=Pseudonocardia sediminis TaxID=1397368 RepID=A0A4V6MDZ7_PSEST|nr:hypothetical protein [Pseudonocardia sediminis]RZT75462.1 hypothetical protein EV383_6202 [Pseudonocardia sediminis]
MHGALLQDQAPDPCGYGIRAVAPSRRAPRGRAARSTDRGGPTTGPGRAPRPRARQRATERAMARGLQRARRRLNAGEFTPHPGWRHFIEAGYRVLTSQTEALADIARRVDDEEWRTDKRHSWALILRRLVLHMDWTTGLITGLTAERLGEAGARAPRTVSRVLAWARDSGLVVVVEAGATAEFLGTDTNRTPTYALVTDRPLPSPKATAPSPLSPVDESGDLPTSNVSSKPLTDGRRAQPTPQPRWPSHAVPGNPGERNAATFTLVSRLGLDGRQAGKIEIWRARAILKTWWDQGACIAGILHAVDHHPDRPDRNRGDACRGADDPLRVLAHRLKPWRGRLNELPRGVVGHRIQVTPPPVPRPAPQVICPADRRAARDAARAALAAHLDDLRERRRAAQ